MFSPAADDDEAFAHVAMANPVKSETKAAPNAHNGEGPKHIQDCTQSTSSSFTRTNDDNLVRTATNPASNTATCRRKHYGRKKRSSKRHKELAARRPAPTTRRKTTVSARRPAPPRRRQRWRPDGPHHHSWGPQEQEGTTASSSDQRSREGPMTGSAPTGGAGDAGTRSDRASREKSNFAGHGEAKGVIK